MVEVHPGSESQPSASRRLLIVLAVVVGILLGVPTWWRSTGVARAPLACTISQTLCHHQQLPLPLHLTLVVASSASPEAWLSEGSSLLADTSDAELLVSVRLDSPSDCRLLPGSQAHSDWPCGLSSNAAQESLRSLSDAALDDWLSTYASKTETPDTEHLHLTVILIRTSEDKPQLARAGSFSVAFGKHRHAWLRVPEGASFKKALQTVLSAVRREWSRREGSMRSREVAVGQTKAAVVLPVAEDGTAVLSMTLLVGNPEDGVYDWDFAALEQQYWQPVADALAPVASLSIESQVLYYAGSKLAASWSTPHAAYVVAASDLPFLVDQNEWHLDVSLGTTGRAKILHWVMYIPPAKLCPLRLQLRSGDLSPTNAFITPSWGGVLIWNPPSCHGSANGSMHHLEVEDMLPVMQGAVAQLRALFGLPLLQSDGGIIHLAAEESGVAGWEVDLLTQRRTVENAQAAGATLCSLAKLADTLPRMVVQNSIAAKACSALAALEIAHTAAAEGHFHTAARAAKQARADAEEVFFNPAIMSLLYFPSEHTLAVYTPLFVPLFMHVAVALKRELSSWGRHRHKSF